MAHPLKKSQRKREEPKLGEPRLVEPDSDSEFVIAQELQGETVADTLIRARQQVGQDLRSIAEVLCIRYSYLDAIERSQFENLPGATYAVGFVRTYAEYLGLDSEQVVERFKSEVEGLDSQTKLHFPTPAPEGKMPGGAVFLVAALLFAGAYGVWFYLSNHGESLSDLVAPVPERLQEMVGGGTSSSPAVAPQVAATAPAPVGSEPVEPVPAAALEAAPQAQAETMPAAASEAVPVPSAERLPQAAPLPPVDSVPSPAAAETAPMAPAAATQTSGTTQPAAPAAPLADAAPASEPLRAPVAEAPAVVMTVPQAETSVAVAPQESGSTLPATSAAAAPAPGNPVAGSTPQQEALADTQATAGTPQARDEPLAIPAAPDSNAPATAFLVNHEPKVYGEENADARIVLKANQDAWVQVRDRQGSLLLTRVLRAGDSYRVPNQGDLTLLTGNAGGLEIVVDGRSLAPLGPVGAVRRNIPLDPQALAGGTAQ